MPRRADSFPALGNMAADGVTVPPLRQRGTAPLIWAWKPSHNQSPKGLGTGPSPRVRGRDWGLSPQPTSGTGGDWGLSWWSAVGTGRSVLFFISGLGRDWTGPMPRSRTTPFLACDDASPYAQFCSAAPCQLTIHGHRCVDRCSDAGDGRSCRRVSHFQIPVRSSRTLFRGPGRAHRS